MSEPTDADRAKAAEVMDRLDNVGAFDHSNDEQRDREYVASAILAALAAARTAAVADLRARVEALAEELSSPRKFALSYGAIADRLRAAVTDTTGGKRQHTAECYERGCTTGSHPAPRPGHRTGGRWTPEELTQ